MRVFYCCFQSLQKLGLTALVLLAAVDVSAQKEAQFSQFSFNQIFFNPATAGKGDQTQVGVVYRSQYSGYKATFDEGGSPTSQLISASLPLGNFGFGIYALNDRQGALGQQDVQISAAYKLSLPKGVLSIGARAGMLRQALDYDRLRPEFPDIEDPAFLTGTVAEMKPDFSVGIHYENEQYYVGASATHLSKPEFRLGTEEMTHPISDVYYFNAGAYLSAGYMLEVQPLILAKIIPAGTISAEGGALVTYDQRFFGGVTYRQQDVITIIHAGAYLLSDQSLRLSGAYDIVARGNKAKAPASFEVMLSYAFGRQKAGQKSIIRTPRFRF